MIRTMRIAPPFEYIVSKDCFFFLFEWLLYSSFITMFQLVEPIMSTGSVSLSNCKLWTIHISMAATIRCMLKRFPYCSGNEKINIWFYISDYDRHSNIPIYCTKFRKYHKIKSSFTVGFIDFQHIIVVIFCAFFQTGSKCSIPQ